MPYPLTPQAIEASIKKLAADFPAFCSAAPLLNPTVPKPPMTPQTYSYLKIGNGTQASRPGMLAVAGLHGREWAQPDATITFAGKLLAACKNNTPFVIPAWADPNGNMHGPVECDAATVQKIINKMDIYLLPLANPDGRGFDQSAFNSANPPGWRKNCSAQAGAQMGVDLNRNFDIAWDYNKYYSPAALAADTRFMSSKTASDEIYIGPTAFSEAETQNIKWLLDSFPILYFMDLHSYAQTIMYSWDMETIQSTDSSQNFQNAAWDGKRDGVTGTAYQEYFPNGSPDRVLDRHLNLANLIKSQIQAATGAVYSVEMGSQMYRDSGSSYDYAFSRQFRSTGAPPMYSLTVEFGGAADGFKPSTSQFDRIEREIHAALISFARYIAIWPGMVNFCLPP